MKNYKIMNIIFLCNHITLVNNKLFCLVNFSMYTFNLIKNCKIIKL